MEETLKEQEEKIPDWKEAFKEEETKSKTVDKRKIEFLLDIPLEVSVELGRTKMLINDLLQLG
ncbi:MAG: flagellar motor switch protein FliN, partial [Candidatus Omnitrophota bacterium]